MPVPALTVRQLAGLGITLAAVAVFSLYTQRQVSGLRRLETEIVDRNRRDSLQLVRIQNDLNALGEALRDMRDDDTPYGLAAYEPQFERLHTDLADALRLEAQLVPGGRSPEQQAMLASAMARFWGEAAQLWELAKAGREAEARMLLRTRLEAERSSMVTLISRFLIQNQEVEETGTQEIRAIYNRVERNLYIFLTAVLTAILLTSLFVIRSNRRIFDNLTQLSDERQFLARRLIDVQEESYRGLARELHDDLGQTLTALGAMLLRVERKMAPDDKSREDLREVREIANQALERMRGLSQMLHPPILDDYGLEKSIAWYSDRFGKQTGVAVHYERIGAGPWIGPEIAIHVYRILQEALNNVVRHAKVDEAWVKAQFEPGEFCMIVEDHGAGLEARHTPAGIGLIGMRERAGLLQGSIDFSRPAEGGTRVTLRVPIAAAETEAG